MYAAFTLIVALIAEPGLPQRYWPEFPAPERILVSENHNDVDFATGLLLHTLSGLVARATADRGHGEMIWIGLKNAPSYDEWLARFQRYTGAQRMPGVSGAWDLVRRYRDQGIVKGYILCRKEPGTRALYDGAASDTSVNVATALCAPLGGVAIEQGLEDKAKECGLPLLLDARGKDEAWLWETHRADCSSTLLGRQDPINFVMRDALVAMRAMIVSGTGPLYEQALAHIAPGSPVLGWGIGLEDAQTGPSSRCGVFQTATNWCTNLPLLSSGKTGLAYPVKPFARPSDFEPAAAEDADARYVAFVLTDGDNVQWLMLNFCLGDEARQYWACPKRGAIPFGWTVPAMDLLQLCPYTLDYLRETASPRDDFVLMSGGYYYPDWFGDAIADKEILAKHARRMGAYMERCGIHLLAVNLQDWDSPAAMRAYETYARAIPNLEGILAFQYAPYTAGGGAVRWVKNESGGDVTVITARNAIWAERKNDPREGAPSRVAAMLNEWAAHPAARPEDRFAWVIVHCWSWFQPPASGAEEVAQNGSHGDSHARGYLPAVWASEHLSPNIRVVTPAGLVQRIKASHKD